MKLIEYTSIAYWIIKICKLFKKKPKMTNVNAIVGCTVTKGCDPVPMTKPDLIAMLGSESELNKVIKYVKNKN